jgi:prepilin-type N-terminal cleavage/methylation domain-containing protein/prepilin-type processing-associated H-X9-DG protein
MRLRPRSVSVRRAPRHGFTLVELLVVIAIIGVLVSLLLPAIQAAREAARRANCQSNLHNMALAVLSYESAKSALPPSSQMEVGANDIELNMFTGPQLSWIVQVLPYMEQVQTYQQFNLKKPFATYISENVSVVPTPEKTQPPLMMCPSDSASGRMFSLAGSRTGNFTGTRIFGKANYVAYASPEHINCSKVWPGALVNEPQEMKRVEDGTSRTIMLTEVRTREEITDQRGAWALAWPGSSVLGLDMHGDGLPSSTVRVCNQGYYAYRPAPALAKGALPPNNPVGAENADDLRVCNDVSGAQLEGMPCITSGSNTAAPRSLHPGGVNATHVDGSVLFIVNEIDPLVMGPMVCINDGLTVGE